MRDNFVAKKSVILGHMHFDKKGDALTFFKEILNRYSPGENVSDEDGEMLSLALANHPEASKKIGSGISYFSVRAAEYGTQCFEVNRTDNTCERFSYIACLK